MIIAVVGATATGKTSLAVALAQEFGGEVISADAFQLYHGMDIGTAKVTEAEAGSIPHHQIDVLDLSQRASVAAYQQHAREDAEAIIARGKVPVVCGGSGLYVRALLDELIFPGTDPKIRSHFQDQLEAVGSVELHKTLATLDPLAASNILPSNGRRVVRALEVIQLTGRPFSATMPTGEYHYADTLQIGLRPDAEVLSSRIEKRCAQMVEQGLVEEVQALLQKGLREAPTARAATGYPQMIDYLDGKIDLATATEQNALATRKLAKKQWKWFKRDDRISWFATPDEALSFATRALTR